ncbi:L-fucose isomerase [Allorhodopirellula heiligendammensis]|uniref:L-fucose isomerase n=1 Tax=Allorhodopirellula heiligendammensis TaxID=2714739 RepID=A0A5C6C8Q9_9BACT|nr:L-fucose isomerase [Allorhodopirellula heiligendammensis]TWU19786.1 L-fucose isomerase [Allorhodopirellula heiligendammensis]
MTTPQTLRTVFQGDLPKIGIRPTIDGRLGGVRESLEDQTMNLAKRVAALIEENVYYPNGAHVECVIADTCIGGVSEAVACDDLFRKQNVGVSLTVTPCWCYGSETMDMDPLRPKAVFGFNGTERPGAVYLAAALAGHTQKGIPAFGIYGRDVQNAGDANMPADVQAKILDFARCGLAVALMRGKAYLSMGGTSMGIAGSMIDYAFWEKWLGMRVEDIDMSEFAGRMNKGQYDQAEYEEALTWVKQHCPEGDDYNSDAGKRTREQLDREWSDCVKMALIARDLMVGNPKLAEMGLREQAHGHQAIAAGFQGQRQWTDHFPNGDFMEAILNTSFDWNGRRAPYLVATENDALNGATMLFGHLLTGTAQVFADLRTYWSPDAVAAACEGYTLEGAGADGLLHLINSGPAALDGTGQQVDGDGGPTMKPFWEITDDEVSQCLGATTWHPSITEYFPGGGMSTRYRTRGGMPATMTRINLVAGLGPALQIAEGHTVELPGTVHDVLDARTNPTWPTTWFAPTLTGKGAFRSTYDVMNQWGANHCVMTAGHVGHLFITLASILRIPVYMHNVDDDRVFRPSAWNAFGTDDRESADFRACNNFGPLYGRV